MLKKLYDWARSHAHTPYAYGILVVLSFLESIVGPPVAPVFVLFCIENKQRVFRYATIATVFSVLGGVVSYFIGYALWESVGHTIIRYVSTPEAFQTMVERYRSYETLAIMVGSFAPMPYKVISISAGFCKLSLFSFMICSLIGRGARYYSVAAVLFIWGESVRTFIDRWFNHLVVLFLVLFSLGFLVVLK